MVGSGSSGTPLQGSAVAFSADGNTAAVAGPNDNGNVGAVWVYTRSGGVWTQQGSKLVGAGYSGVPFLGQSRSVALSADGNTLMIGGSGDNSGAGAAWVFTRGGGVWTQQGSKLVPSDETGSGRFGYSAALSADGNTAVVGGPEDNNATGAAWVFTRSGGVWTQQGSKLVAGDESGPGLFGAVAAMNGAGTTVLIGGYGDNADAGAAWVFTQSGGVWTQQGSKLAASDAINSADLGYAVSLSADGNTALIGGPGDNNLAGAAWVFTQSGGTWSQQGAKFVGTGAVGSAEQGIAVALSADARTAAIGGLADNNGAGATWLFTQKNGTWSQKGSKLVGTGASGAAQQGSAVALSANASTLLVGAPTDNHGIGAAWVFTPDNLVDTHDFNADAKSDILWRDTVGDTTIWLMNGPAVLQGVSLGNVPPAWSVVGVRDFNGDGDADILWRDTSGDVTMWLMNGGMIAQGASLGNIPAAWSVAGTGDFNGDGKGDILWRDTSGDTTIWLMNGGTILQSVSLGTVSAAIWSVAGTGDFNGDGTTDILWRDTAGDVSIWLISGGSIQQGVSLGNIPTTWSIAGTGDFNGDSTTDILWRDTAGDVMIWLISNGALLQQSVLGTMPTTWHVAETGDFNGDGNSDILWIDTSGNVQIWFMNGFTVTSAVSLGNVGTPWSVQGANAD